MKWPAAFAVLALLAPAGVMAQRAPGDPLLDAPARLDVRNVGLEAALVALQRESGVAIGFSPDFVPAERRVTCRCRTASVRRALAVLLEGTDLAVRATATQILIAPRPDSTRMLSGRVLDRDTRRGVPGAAVRVLDPDRTAISDSTGAFVLFRMPRSRLRLVVGRVGVRADTVTVPADRDAVTLFVNRRSVELVPIVVTAPAAMRDRARFEESAQASTLSFEAAEIRAIPGTLEPDVMRAVQLTPGTVSRSDYSVGYNVRGGENDQNLVLLDGITVFNPVHLGGLFSTFAPQAIESFDFQAGGFPASYGNRLSSVLDLHVRDGADDHLHGRVQVSLLSTSLALDGPIGPARFLVSARRTYADLVVRTFTQYELPYYFTDVIGKVTLPLGRSGSLSTTAYWGRDALDLEIVERDTTQSADSPIQLGFSWGNRLVGAAWRQQVGGGVFSLHGGVTEFGARLDISPDIAALENGIGQTFARAEYRFSAGAGHRAAVGIGVERYHARFRIDEPTFETSATEYDDYGFLPILNRTYRPTVWSAFAEDEWRVFSRLIVRPGARLTYVGLNGFTALDPRFSFRWFLTDGSAVIGSLGRYHQPTHSLRDQDLPVTPYEFWVATDERVPVGRSDQVVLGYERWVGDGWQIAIEGYRKTFHDLIVPNRALALRDEGDEFLPMDGNSWGVDAWVRRHVGRVRGWIGYGYAKAVRRVGGATFPASHDRRHTLNVIVEAPGPLGADLGVRWTYGSPLPFTGFQGEWGHHEYSAGLNAFAQGEDEPVALGINDQRFPHYQRLDAGLRWRFGGWGAEWRPYLQIANLYNHRNVFWYDYSFGRPPTRTGISQVPFVPTFGLEISW